MDDFFKDPEVTFPVVPLPLLEELERRFPDRCPELNDEERAIWARAGSVRVTRLLRHFYNLQHESR